MISRTLIISTLLGFGMFMAFLSYERNFTHVYENYYQAMIENQKKFAPNLDQMICAAAEDKMVTSAEHRSIFEWLIENQGYFSVYTPESEHIINARERFFDMTGELCNHEPS